MQNGIIANTELVAQRELLLSSLLEFTQVFYYLRTHRCFNLSHPIARESHIITICRELVKVIKGETTRLMINVPPRYGKTELIIHFVAWALAQFPDSNFLYTSYSLGLAKKQSKTIKNIVGMKEYFDLFGVGLSEDVNAQGNFESSMGGTIYAAGAEGEITGRGAGIQGCDRFGGAILIDDIHKPAEVTSDTMRESVIDWYFNTLLSRLNDPKKTPIIFIGQRLHESDLAAELIKSGEWRCVIIPALDGAGNALHPDMHDVGMLKNMRETMPYVFASQYQQDPQPAGGAIFKEEWFVKLDDEPEILGTFITGDTAETNKTYNDPTVFSHWGIYKIKDYGFDTDLYGLHWLNCWEVWVEPKDLEKTFIDFYIESCRHKVKPKHAAIEKKSSGVTLISVLNARQGLTIIDIERTKVSGNKATRYLEAQPYVSSRQISLPVNAKHTNMCIEHCKKITANDSHAHDDICDTMYDAIKTVLIDKTLISLIGKDKEKELTKANVVMGGYQKLQQARMNRNFR